MARSGAVAAIAVLASAGLLASCGKEQSQAPAQAPTVAATTPPVAAQRAPAILSVESDPPGADVEIGLQTVNGVVTPGTGRHAGITPCQIELRPSDVAQSGGIACLLRKDGYFDFATGVTLGGSGKEIQPGRTYVLQAKLHKIGE